MSFAMEIVRILERLSCTVYTASIDKRRVFHEMEPEAAMLLQLRGLSEHFAVECALNNEIGLLVSDWSGKRLDAMVSRNLARFNSRNELPLHPSVYFSDSVSSQAIQVADLVAGVRRRVLEGDRQIQDLAAAFGEVRSLPQEVELRTHTGKRFSTAIQII